MSPVEEVALLQRSRQGDDSARETLYLQFFSENKQVRGLLSREISNPADREDVLHDAYLSLIRSNSEFRGESRLHTYVYRIVQIAILQKRRSARADREDRMVRLTIQRDGEERERELAITDYQYQEVDAGATAERLYALLPEPLRTAFRLRVAEELSYEEIAQITGAPINTVSTRIFKARAHLAKLFGAPTGTPGEVEKNLSGAGKKGVAGDH
jgi:RNA polymerase sigma-70 factor, ECF subfamily